MLWINFCWLVFLATFAWSHWRTRRTRADVPVKEVRIRRAPISNFGLTLQFAGILLISILPATERPGLLWLGLLGCIGGIGLSVWALYHLGRQWRVQAVIAEGHELITSGPYRHVRHPVYLALLFMLLGTAVVHSTLVSAGVGIGLYLLGTEIRVGAEERILREHFGAQFDAFRSKTYAYIPILR